MFKIYDKNILIEDFNYRAFPDIMIHPDTKDLYIIHRVSDYHHPTYSSLVVHKSIDQGSTWQCIFNKDLSMDSDSKVFNCPRLSMYNGKITIITDTKTDRREVDSKFETYFYTINGVGDVIREDKLPFIGMVPDRLVKFEGNYHCANHVIKDKQNSLIQLVNKQDNWGNWFTSNVVANSNIADFCEASLVPVGDTLYAYLRNNANLSGNKEDFDYEEHLANMRNACLSTSVDGYNWSCPKLLPFFGHRIVAIHDEENGKIVGTYRDTENCSVSIFTHDPSDIDNTFEKAIIEQETTENMYHMGYTGIVKTGTNEYLVVYYTKSDREKPFIKTCKVKYIGN